MGWRGDKKKQAHAHTNARVQNEQRALALSRLSPAPSGDGGHTSSLEERTLKYLEAPILHYPVIYFIGLFSFFVTCPPVVERARALADSKPDGRMCLTTHYANRALPALRHCFSARREITMIRSLSKHHNSSCCSQCACTQVLQCRKLGVDKNC